MKRLRVRLPAGTAGVTAQEHSVLELVTSEAILVVEEVRESLGGMGGMVDEVERKGRDQKVLACVFLLEGIYLYVHLVKQNASRQYIM